MTRTQEIVSGLLLGIMISMWMAIRVVYAIVPVTWQDYLISPSRMFYLMDNWDKMRLPWFSITVSLYLLQNLADMAQRGLPHTHSTPQVQEECVMARFNAAQAVNGGVL